MVIRYQLCITKPAPLGPGNSLSTDFNPLKDYDNGQEKKK